MKTTKIGLGMQKPKMPLPEDPLEYKLTNSQEPQSTLADTNSTGAALRSGYLNPVLGAGLSEPKLKC